MAVGKDDEKMELLSANIWSKRANNSMYGLYNQVSHDVMLSILHGEPMESHCDAAKVTALIDAAERLSIIGEDELARNLIKQVATLEALSIVGPFAHRLKIAGRKKNPYWSIILELAEVEIKNHPHRRYSAVELAKQARSRFKMAHPEIKESNIPKVETIRIKVKALAERTEIRT